jgi:hypothetical protein
MSGISYLDVFSVELGHDQDDGVGPGDRVATGSNHFPQYQVIAAHGDMAWLRDVQSGADYLVPLRRCRRLEAPALAMAAE